MNSLIFLPIKWRMQMAAKAEIQSFPALSANTAWCLFTTSNKIVLGVVKYHPYFSLKLPAPSTPHWYNATCWPIHWRYLPSN